MVFFLFSSKFKLFNMLKLIIPAAVLSLVLASCGGVSAEDNKKGVKAVCECMTKADQERAAEDTGDGLDLGDALRDFDYSLCALEGAMGGADVNSDDFANQLASDCPDLKDLHTKYLETAAE